MKCEKVLKEIGSNGDLSSGGYLQSLKNYSELSLMLSKVATVGSSDLDC